MSAMRWRGLGAGGGAAAAALVLALGGCVQTASAPPPDPHGPCSFRVDGDTVEQVDETSLFNVSGSGLWLTCEHIGTFGDPAVVRLTLDIKLFEGPKTYQLDPDAKYGEVEYTTNDGLYTQYTSFSPDSSTGCTVDVTEAPAKLKDGDMIAGTFTCRLAATTANWDYVYVDVTNGSFSGPAGK